MGGRKRKDGLRPGSPEAREADKAKDRERKRLAAERQRQTLPPVLPPAASVVPGSPAAQPASPGDPLPLASAGAPAVILWQRSDLLPVTRNAVPLLEAAMIGSVLQKAKKARLPESLIDQIEKDAKWDTGPKTMLAETSSALAAKYLNKYGVSAEYKDEVNFGVAVGAILGAQMALQRRLDKLIAAANAGQSQPGASQPAKTP